MSIYKLDYNSYRFTISTINEVVVVRDASNKIDSLDVLPREFSWKTLYQIFLEDDSKRLELSRKLFEFYSQKKRFVS